MSKSNLQLRLFQMPAPKTNQGEDFIPTSPFVSVDFETYYQKEEVGVSELGIYHYINHPECEAYLVSVSDGKMTWVGHPSEFPWQRIAGLRWVSHNAAFDGSVFAHLVLKGIIPVARPSRWSCTACLSNYFGSERSLDAACEYLLGVKVSKDVRTKMSGCTWQDAVDSGMAQELVDYAREDALRCWQLWDRYGSKWPEKEQRLAEMTIRQGLRGFYVDRPYLGEALTTTKAQLWQAQQSLPAEMRNEVEAGGTGLSTKALILACRSAGIEPPYSDVFNHKTGRVEKKIVTAEDNDDFDEWAKTYQAQVPWVRTINSVRKLNITLGRLKIVESRIRPDGCMSFELKYFNSGTGRWTGGGGYSVQNLLKSNTTTLLEPVLVSESFLQPFIIVPDKGEVNDIVGIPGAGLFQSSTVEKLEKEKMGELWPYGKLKEAYKITLTRRLHPGHLVSGSVIPAGQRAVLGGTGIDVRGLIMARPGYKLVICDLSQIEPRVLNWLIGNTKLLNLMREGMSIYEAYARVSMGWTGGELKREDRTKYAMTKVIVLGLGYSCGPAKFRTIAKAWSGLDLPEEECEKQVKAFRRDNPGIPARWGKHDLAMKMCLGTTYKTDLPSGRALVYNDIHMRPGYKGIEYYGVGLNRGVRQAKKLYGGTLVENEVQAIARDIFAEGLLRIADMEPQGVHCLFTVHDEAVCETPLDFDPSRITAAMTRTPDWIPGIPLAAEAEVSDRYKK